MHIVMKYQYIVYLYISRLLLIRTLKKLNTGESMFSQAKIEKLAKSGIDLVKSGPESLTGAAIKVASENGLNPYEVEHLCARMNHIYFREKFSESRTAQFDIARHKDINEAVQKEDVPEKVAHYVIDCAYDLFTEVEDNTKVASDDGEISEGLRKKNLGESVKVMFKLEDQILKNAMETDNAQRRLYDVIKEYVKDGENLSDIHEALLKSWGQENKENITSIFKDIKAELGNDKVAFEDITEYKDLSDFDDREPVENIKQAAQKIQDLNDEARKLVFMQLKTAHIVCDNDGYKIAEMRLGNYTTRSMINEIYGEILRKEANVVQGYGDLANTISVMNNQNLSNAAGSLSRGLGASSGWRNVISQGVRRAGPLLAVSAAAFAADKVIDAFKRNKVRASIKGQFPELLGDIPDQDIEKYFNFVAQQMPELLDNPIALANQIAKYHAHGAIDTSAVVDLTAASEKSQKRRGYQLSNKALSEAIKTLAGV